MIKHSYLLGATVEKKKKMKDSLFNVPIGTFFIGGGRWLTSQTEEHRKETIKPHRVSGE